MVTSCPSSPAASYQQSSTPSNNIPRLVSLLNDPSHSTATPEDMLLSPPVPRLRKAASAAEPASMHFKPTGTTTSTPLRPPERSYSTNSVQKRSVEVGPSSFTKIKLLGRGDVGKVYLVQQKDNGRLYALKGNLFLSFDSGEDNVL